MADAAVITDSLTQLQAWRLWLDNVNIADAPLLFDIRVRNWARIGKGLQAAAAVFVIVEIIGAERIDAWGKLIQNFANRVGANKLYVTAVQLLAVSAITGLSFDVLWRIDQIAAFPVRALRRLLRGVLVQRSRWRCIGSSLRRLTRSAFLSRLGTRRRTRLVRIRLARGHRAFERIALICGLAFWLLMAVAIFGYYRSPTDQRVPLLELIFGMLVLTMGLFLATLLASAAAMLVLASLLTVFAWCLHVIAWAPAHKKFEHTLKLVGIGIFLIGFYFDLLAS